MTESLTASKNAASANRSPQRGGVTAKKKPKKHQISSSKAQQTPTPTPLPHDSQGAVTVANASGPSTLILDKRLLTARTTQRLDFSVALHHADDLISHDTPVQVFPRQIFVHEHLSGHHLREIWLTNHHISVLPAEIAHFPQLHVLGLGGNALSTLPPEISSLSSLESLYLERNNLQVIPDHISFPRQLRDLRLDRNALTAFPAQITQLRLLNRLGLSYNGLTVLPVEIRRLRNLVELDVDHNRLTSDGIPNEEMAQLQHLERLGLDGNCLAERPPCLRRMPNATYVRLSGNGRKDESTDANGFQQAPRRDDGSNRQTLQSPPSRDHAPHRSLYHTTTRTTALDRARAQNLMNAQTYREAAALRPGHVHSEQPRLGSTKQQHPAAAQREATLNGAIPSPSSPDSHLCLPLSLEALVAPPPPRSLPPPHILVLRVPHHHLVLDDSSGCSCPPYHHPPSSPSLSRRTSFRSPGRESIAKAALRPASFDFVDPRDRRASSAIALLERHHSSVAPYPDDCFSEHEDDSGDDASSSTRRATSLRKKNSNTGDPLLPRRQENDTVNTSENDYSVMMASPGVPLSDNSSGPPSSARHAPWYVRYRALEFTLSLLMCAGAGAFALMKTHMRDIPRVEVMISKTQTVFARDPSLDNKKLAEQVPMFALLLGATSLPILSNLFINYALPKFKRVRVIPHDSRDFLLSLCQSVGISQLITHFVKNMTGRFRPSFYDMCKWDHSKVWDGVTNLCQDKKHELEGRRSFPSGHASYAFATLFLLTLYLLGRSRLNCENRDETILRGGRKTLKLFLCFVPTLLASWIAVTRSVDNWHHYADILAGSIIGVLAAGFGYSYNYGSIFNWESAGVPYQEAHVRRKKRDHEMIEASLTLLHSSTNLHSSNAPMSQSNASYMTADLPPSGKGDEVTISIR